MNVFTVSFFGHRYLSETVQTERRLEQEVRNLLNEKEYVEFLVGRDGEFDILAASVIRRVRRAVGEESSSLVWVLPYPTADFRENEKAYYDYFDDIEICEASAEAHPKAAFALRNRAMIDRSDYVIFCVERKKGGAYEAMQYAVKSGKFAINITDML